MLKRRYKIVLLIITVILTFFIGVRFELDYRMLTRKTVQFFANYELKYYGGKEFRWIETDIAFILTLVPIGLYITMRKLYSVKTILIIVLLYLALIPIFFSFYCFIESQYIKLTVTEPIMKNGLLQYHFDDVNYRMILFLTVITTFLTGLLIKRQMK